MSVSTKITHKLIWNINKISKVERSKIIHYKITTITLVALKNFLKLIKLVTYQIPIRFGQFEIRYKKQINC